MIEATLETRVLIYVWLHHQAFISVISSPILTNGDRVKRHHPMSTTTRLTFEEFEKLPEQEGVHYELDEGELLMEPSPTFFHNAVRARIAQRLRDFVDVHQLGYVIEEMGFRLSPDTVRNPDVAFVTTDHLRTIDINRSPVIGAPALAVEVIFPQAISPKICRRRLSSI
jgi:Uma2 family endonuclease